MTDTTKTGVAADATALADNELVRAHIHAAKSSAVRDQIRAAATARADALTSQKSRLEKRLGNVATLSEDERRSVELAYRECCYSLAAMDRCQHIATGTHSRDS